MRLPISSVPIDTKPSSPTVDPWQSSVNSRSPDEIDVSEVPSPIMMSSNP